MAHNRFATKKLRKPLHDEDKNSEIKKFCVDCKTTKTPLWRCGPSGPKTLCNACGIKYRKKKRVMAGLEKSGRKKRKSHTSTSTIGATNCSNTSADIVKTRARNGLMSESLKMGLMMLRGLEKSGRKKKKSHTSTSTIGAANCSNTSADTVKTRVRNGLMSESLKMGLMLHGLEKSGRKKKKSHTSTSTIGATNCSNTSADTVKTRVRNGLMSGESLKMGLMLRGNEMVFQKSPIVKKQRCQRRRKLGEEEQAAFSLMALSCGSVLA